MDIAALRRCLVCEWEGLQMEPTDTDEIGPACPTCGAPTERVAAVKARPVNPHAAALGRLGGLKGGRARAAGLSPRRRREIARLAANARWGRKGSRTTKR